MVVSDIFWPVSVFHDRYEIWIWYEFGYIFEWFSGFANWTILQQSLIRNGGLGNDVDVVLSKANSGLRFKPSVLSMVEPAAFKLADQQDSSNLKRINQNHWFMDSTCFNKIDGVDEFLGHHPKHWTKHVVPRGQILGVHQSGLDILTFSSAQVAGIKKLSPFLSIKRSKAVARASIFSSNCKRSTVFKSTCDWNLCN